MWKSIINPTEKIQACAFKLISRAGCMVEYLLRHPHTASQFDCFNVVYNRTLAPGLIAKATAAPCMLHPSVLALVSRYGKDFGNDDSVMELFLIMHSTRTDISNLESLHALVRRILQSRQQTHKLDLVDTNSSWVLERQRSDLPQPGLKMKRSQSAPDLSQPALKKQKNHTNSWHLWCRQAEWPRLS